MLHRLFEAEIGTIKAKKKFAYIEGMFWIKLNYFSRWMSNIFYNTK